MTSISERKLNVSAWKGSWAKCSAAEYWKNQNAGIAILYNSFNTLIKERIPHSQHMHTQVCEAGCNCYQ